MSRFAAIDVAIRLELLKAGKNIAYLNRFGPTVPVNAAVIPAVPEIPGYGYDERAMRQFLLAVAERLRQDEPPLSFAWRMIDVNQCLDADHRMLVHLIEDQIRTGD